MLNSLSIATGYPTPSSRVARRTLSRSCSNPNSGACTPTTTSPRSRYRSLHARTYGSVRSQLTHEYVQKSTATTWPRSAAAVSGSEFSQTGAASSAASALGIERVDAIATRPRRERRSPPSRRSSVSSRPCRAGSRSAATLAPRAGVRARASPGRRAASVPPSSRSPTPPSRSLRRDRATAAQPGLGPAMTRTPPNTTVSPKCARAPNGSRMAMPAALMPVVPSSRSQHGDDADDDRPHPQGDPRRPEEARREEPPLGERGGGGRDRGVPRRAPRDRRRARAGDRALSGRVLLGVAGAVLAAVAATKTRPSPYVVVRRSVGIVKPYWQV